MINLLYFRETGGRNMFNFEMDKKKIVTVKCY